MRKIVSVAMLCLLSSVVVAVPLATPAYAAVSPTVVLTTAQTLPLVGEQVQLNVAFDNAGSGAIDTGYGPYVDLLFNTSGADGNDGMTFSGATYLGSTVAPKATFACTGALVLHPLTGALVACPAGRQLVVVQLPFGSFTADQPPANLAVTANLSNLADVGAVLAVTATPVFAYGNSPTGNTPITGSVQTISFTPQVVRFTKTYVGPELETATGPNYVRQFRLSLDIANGQQVTGLTVTDNLPPQYAYHGNVTSSSATTAIATPVLDAPSTVQRTLTRTFNGTITGTSVAEDAFVQFDYFIPLNDAAPIPVLDPSTGDDLLTRNDGSAAGTVVPLDVRDANQPFTINPNLLSGLHPDDVEMTAKSIAVQKSVADIGDIGGVGPTPGDTLQYTISGQVSDYFTFAGVSVADVLGDGQTLDGTFAPTLQINEAGSTYAVPLASYFTPDTSARTTCGDGTTAIQFDISNAYGASFGAGDGAGGVLTGGRVSTIAAATTFTITFRSVIDDAYTCLPSPANRLDPRDFVANGATVSGEVYDNTTQSPQVAPQFESDTSGTRVDVAPDSVAKSIWARNGVVGGFAGSPAKFAASDLITYRLSMHLPSTDVSALAIADYLPLPVLAATSLAHGADCTASSAPALGQWCYGPADTLHTAISGDPSVAASAAGNSITWTYGDREDASNTPTDIELLFTLQISDAAFREGLFLTNQVQALENNSFGSAYSNAAITQIELTEPLLNIRKGVADTTTQTPAATFSGTRFPVGATFGSAGSATCPSASANVTSTSIANTAPNANVSGLDAMDLVRFAIVVENTGSGLDGAFDVSVSDVIPVGFDVPSSGLHLCVRDGAGTSLANTATGFFAGSPTSSPLGTGTIELTDGVTGALTAYSSTSGTNIAVITYDLQVAPGIGANTSAATLTNTANITDYAATEGGPSFLPVTPAAALTNTATVSTKPLTIAKALTSTDQASTTGTSVAIGERAEYTVTVTVPEGVSRNVQLVDTLPAGLALAVAPGAATVGSALTPSAVGGPTVSNGGHTLTYTFGDITNSDTNNATTASETITFNYWVVALDVVGNQSGTALNNSAAISYYRSSTGTTTSTHTAATPVSVVEPNLNVAKSASSSTVQGNTPLTYTLVVDHASSTAGAFDATLADTIPAGLTYAGGLASSGTAPTTLGIVGNVISATWTAFPTSASTTITFNVTVDPTYNTVSAIQNTASIAWTSLPGSPTATTYDANGLERTGAGGVNDYVDSAVATVQPIAPAISKSLFATDQASTAGANVTIGEVLTYDLLVTLPEGDIPGLTVTDQIPSGLQYVSSQIIAGSYGATLPVPTVTGGASNGDDVVFTFGATTNTPDGVTTNNSFTARVVAQVLDVAGNVGFGAGQLTLQNRGVVQISGSTAVNSAFVGTPVVEPHMVITKTFSPTTASQGDTVTVNLSVVNTGLSTANEVIVTDALDSYFDEATALEGTTPSGFTYSRVGNTITYTGGSIAAGATAIFSLTVQLDAVVPIGTVIPNTAVVAQATTLPGIVVGERDEPDVSSLANLNSVGPDLQLSKNDGVTTLTPGGSTTYNLVITNTGGFQATGVAILDTLPPGTTFTSVGGAGCADGGLVGSDRRIAVSGPIAASGGSVTCTITVAVSSPAAPGTASYLNTASVSDDGANGPDPTPGNNTASDNDLIAGRAPNLVISKTDGVTALAPGQATTYTITVSNPGNIGVTNVAVSDTIPAGLAYTACTPLTGAVSVACSFNSGVVTISFASIAGGGGMASFTIAATVTDPVAAGINSVTNSVSVVNDNANGPETSTADNTAVDTDTVDAAPDMSVAKSHTELSVAPGGAVHYQLLVANAGDQDATGLTVTDTLDSQMTIDCASTVPAATTCNASTGVVVWGPGLATTGSSVGPFASRSNRTLTYTANADTPVTAGTVSFINNVAVADDGLNGPDPTPIDNADNDVVPLAGNAPELSITKTDGVTTAQPAGTLTYTMVVTNSGNIAATGVTISDTLPSSVSFVSCTASCNSSSLPLVTWAVGSVVGGGGQTTVTVTVLVNDPVLAGTGSLSNSASVADDGANGTDPVPANNSATDTDTLLATPDLVVTKTDGVTTHVAGDQFTYTITVSNVGHQAATNVTVLDTLPSTLTAVSCPATPVPCIIGTGVAAGTVSWAVPSLNGGAALATPAANSTLTLSLTVDLDGGVASGVSSFTNTARADDDGANGTDPTPGNNQATDTDTFVALPDLQITKSDGVTTTEPGSTLTYSLIVTNVGAQTATGVTITDTLPPGVTFVSCAPTCDSSALPLVQWTNAVETAAGLPADPAGFDSLGQATFTVVVSVDSPVLAGIDDLDNSATVTDDGANGADPTPTNNLAQDVDLLDAAPDLGVTKTDGVLSLLPGQTLSYAVQFRNQGTQNATGVVVTDALPAGVTFVSCSDVCDPSATPVIRWNVGALDVGQVVDYLLVVTVDDPIDPAAVHFVNTVAIADDGTNGPDENPADDSWTDDDTSGVDLAVTKTDGQTTAVPGAPVTYTIVVTNNGPTTIQTFQLIDSLPAALQGVQFAASAGTYDATSHTWTDFGDFAQGQSLTLLVSATVDPVSTVALTNSVQVVAPPSAPDRDLSNNIAVDTDTLVPTATLIIDKQLATLLVRGESAVYTISVRNAGPSAATDVTITDTLPATLTYVGGLGAGWTCPPAPALIVTCSLNSALLPGETRTLDISVIVTGDFGAGILNQATVSSPTALGQGSVTSDGVTGNISPQPTPPKALPTTGSDPFDMLLLGLLLLAPGLVIAAVTRRRVTAPAMRRRR